VARVVYPQHYSAERVRRELGALLADDAAAEQAAAVGAAVSLEDGAAVAAEAIERLVEGSRS
jgi:UDP:flavonoid glycosyltransferase YjiC (YdhE family)